MTKHQCAFIFMSITQCKNHAHVFKLSSNRMILIKVIRDKHTEKYYNAIMHSMKFFNDFLLLQAHTFEIAASNEIC